LVPLLTEHSHKHAAESAAIHTHSAERPPDLWKTGMTFRDTRCSAHARARSLRTRFVPATRSAGNRRVEHTAGHWQFDREDPRTEGQSSTAYELTEEITDETTPPIAAAPAGHGAGAKPFEERDSGSLRRCHGPARRIELLSAAWHRRRECRRRPESNSIARSRGARVNATFFPFRYSRWVATYAHPLTLYPPPTRQHR
jgi:hypothetical protein